ncbi:MAG: hypothetical protein WC643_02965 [Parcubacteria group bacterium]|jgi:hypothetical protein
MKQKQQGSGLIFAVVLLFVILGMVVTLSSVTMLETKMNQKTKSSVGAFYNSESGVEWALNQIVNGAGNIDVVFSGINGATGKKDCPDFGSGTSPCSIYFLDSEGKVINSANAQGIRVTDDISNIKAVRSVGTQGVETQRAIEAAVAATGGGCYVDYSLATGLAVGTSCGAVGRFTIRKSAGMFGGCYFSTDGYIFRPPGSGCGGAPNGPTFGEAYVCCQN